MLSYTSRTAWLFQSSIEVSQTLSEEGAEKNDGDDVRNLTAEEISGIYLPSLLILDQCGLILDIDCKSLINVH